MSDLPEWIQRSEHQKEQIKALAKDRYYEEGMGLEDLLGLVSILVDFCCSLRPIDIDNYDCREIEDNLLLLFANMDTFIHVCDGYAVIYRCIDSKIEWGEITPKSVKQLIDQTYERFEAENDFYLKVRHVLDLFKMALVLAGLVYRNQN